VAVAVAVDVAMSEVQSARRTSTVAKR